jgi:RND family efflux transporter MFP subunit
MTHPTPVTIEIAALAPVTRILAVNGRIAAVHSVDVRSVVTGPLVLLAVAAGDPVDAGQILARVDPSAQTALVRQAMAGLDVALVAQAQAKEIYARALALDDNISITLVEANAHAVQSAEREVARQTAILDQANIVLETFTIRAPVAGNVLALDVDQGQVVGPSVPLLTLADLNYLVAEADVDEAYATQIAMNQPAVLRLAGETRTRDGHVSFVSTRVDVATGGLAIKVTFEEPVAAAIGLTVATNIIVDQHKAALTVPRTAMFTGTHGTGVYVVADNVAHFQPLTVTDWPAARLLVTQGLAQGDIIIVDATGITDGQAVAVDKP